MVLHTLSGTFRRTYPHCLVLFVVLPTLSGTIRGTTCTSMFGGTTYSGILVVVPTLVLLVVLTTLGFLVVLHPVVILEELLYLLLSFGDTIYIGSLCGRTINRACQI